MTCPTHPEEPLRVVSYGGGTNSTALLIGLYERGIRPDLILFADTGGEHDRTYAHVERVRDWCASVGFPEIQVVSNGGPDRPHMSLEGECLTNKTLPSKAFGFSGCSVKWKRQPMDRYVREWQPAVDAFERGQQVLRLIGIDAGERHRGKIPDTAQYRYVYPLIEWNWAREECIEAIERAGLELPGKSACWFCPAMKKREVLALAKERPDLFERSVAMERTAREAGNLKTTAGLGRAYSWEALVAADDAQLKLFPEPQGVACACFDGDEED